jgi:protein-disulfide isomerase
VRPTALLLALAGVAAVSPQAAAAQARVAVDWSKRVAATPQGGFLMGNPAAKVKLVEYGSLTCGHCAAFNSAAKTALTAKVRTGKVSFEYRSHVLNGVDIAATLIARCGGAPRFFPLADKFFASQKDWFGKVTGMPEAQKEQLKALPEGQMLVRMAEIGGLIQIGAAGGVPAARAKACLADPAALDRLGKANEAANALGVTGTPTFLLNGNNVGTQTWASLEPLIRQAGG